MTIAQVPLSHLRPSSGGPKKTSPSSTSATQSPAPKSVSSTLSQPLPSHDGKTSTSHSHVHHSKPPSPFAPPPLPVFVPTALRALYVWIFTIFFSFYQKFQPVFTAKVLDITTRLKTNPYTESYYSLFKAKKEQIQHVLTPFTPVFLKSFIFPPVNTSTGEEKDALLSSDPSEHSLLGKKAAAAAAAALGKHHHVKPAITPDIAATEYDLLSKTKESVLLGIASFRSFAVSQFTAHVTPVWSSFDVHYIQPFLATPLGLTLSHVLYVAKSYVLASIQEFVSFYNQSRTNGFKPTLALFLHRILVALNTAMAFILTAYVLPAVAHVRTAYLEPLLVRAEAIPSYVVARDYVVRVSPGVVAHVNTAKAQVTFLYQQHVGPLLGFSAAAPVSAQ